MPNRNWALAPDISKYLSPSPHVSDWLMAARIRSLCKVSSQRRGISTTWSWWF